MKEVVALFDPSIALDEISVEDFEEGSNPRYKNPDGSETKHSKIAGTISPYVVINGMKFAYEFIENLEIDISGFLPRLVISIREKAGTFMSKAYPKDGDVVNVYIRSESRDFKPIRQDYRILDVVSPVSRDNIGEDNIYTITAILNLPSIFVDRIKSFPNMTSFDALQQVARDLGLGFATNDTATNDSMTWVCPYVPYIDFIQNDLMSASYKDDDSFYICFIDQYYYLNFIQVNDMLVHDYELGQVRVNQLLGQDYHPDSSSSINSEMADLFLSNSMLMGGTPNHIIGFTPLNGSGVISLMNGYRTFLQYYDKNERDFSQYFIETLSTPESEDKIILKGRENEDHTQQVKTIRFGYQFGDNVHSNYRHAKLQNNYNMSELKKLGLICNLAGINPLIYRNMIIPVVIITSKGSDIKRISTKDKDQTESSENQQDITFDKFLTGWYIIGGIKLMYNKKDTEFYTHLILSRREYEIPK